MKRIRSVLQGPNPPENLPPPLTEKTLPDCNTIIHPSGPSLKVGRNSYYHSPFPNKNMAHSLTHSLTHLLTCLLTYSLTHLLAWKGWRKTVITVVSPKQKIIVFINSYNFNFAAFILLI